MRRCRAEPMRNRPRSFVLGPDVRVLDPETLTDIVAGIREDPECSRSVGGIRSATTRTPPRPNRRSRSSTGSGCRSPATMPSSKLTARSGCSGRGSVCINTGGEKVFPEEVEEVLKLHPEVRDAVVVGIPDDRFGQADHRRRRARAGGTVGETELIDHTKTQLAGYKAPRRVRFVESIGPRRLPGKVDYARHSAETADGRAQSLPAEPFSRDGRLPA